MNPNSNPTRLSDGPEMNDDSLLGEVLQELNCTQYLNLIQGEVFQLVSGYLYCAVCILEIEDDPSAVPLRPFTRNLSLEKIAQVLQRKCTHAKNGCTFMGYWTKMKNHETTCMLRPRVCPTTWTVKSECSWRGSGREMTEHFEKDHPERMRYELSPTFKVEGLRDGRPPKTHFMHTFIVHDVVFVFILFVDVKTKLFWTGCYYFKDILDNHRFYFIMGIKKPGNKSRGPEFGCVCAFRAEDAAQLTETCFMRKDYSHWMKLCDENGDLHYTIKVMDNDLVN